MNSISQQPTRSMRATVKKFYIYVVLFLIVFVFSTVKLGEVEMFGRGHFLSPDSIITDCCVKGRQVWRLEWRFGLGLTFVHFQP